MYGITIYTTGPACMRCRMTARKAADLGLSFTEIDVRQNAEALRWISEDLGYTEAPVVVVEDGTDQDHWGGFRPDQLARIAAH